MSQTAIVWLALWGILAVATFKRPAYGAALYMHSYFAFPGAWWWGKQSALGSQRWSLYASLILLAAVLLHLGKKWRNPFAGRWTDLACVLMALNGIAVHFLLAKNRNISYGVLDLLLKFSLLYWVLTRALRTKEDIHILILSVALGGGYIGYEVKINEAGKFKGGRLEKVGPPAADASNTLACLMVATLPSIAYLAIAGTGWSRRLAIVSAPFILNVILLCNSRGGFLGMVAAGIFLLLASRGKVRKKVYMTLLVGAIGVYMLLGDDRIYERFLTTFAGEEERDQSAASRLVFWGAALKMIRDYPLGTGGDGWKKVHAAKYLGEVGVDVEAKSVHNGYLNDTCDWGILGIIFRVAFLWTAMWTAYRTMRHQDKLGNAEDGFLGTCIVAGIAAFSIHSIFGSYLDSEWGFWLAAMATSYGRIFGPAPNGSDSVPAEPTDQGALEPRVFFPEDGS